MHTNVVELEGTCEETSRQSQPNPTPDVNHDKRTEDTQEEFDTASSFGGSEESEEEEVKKKRERRKPSWMTSGDYVYMIGPSEEKDPNSYDEVLQSENKNQWLNAINEELKSLKENCTWELVERPKGIKILKNRWVLRQKTTEKGEVRFKARLVAKGYVQKQGIDYEETLSSVARYDTIRALLAVAAAENLELAQFDIKTAFLNGTLEENVYMEQPEGFEDSTERVCLLRKSLYGLKQAPRCWNERFKKFMKKAGFKNSDADPCLFYRI